MRLPIHTPYRVLSIDPGTNHLGVALSQVAHLGETGLVPYYTVTHAFTAELANIHNYHGLDRDLYEHKKYRLLQIEDLIQTYIHDIDLVAVESPFFYFKKPQAFAALIETMTCIEYNVLRYKPNIPFVRIEPRLVKKIVQAKDHSSKTATTDALAALFQQHETLTCQVDLSTLDEHAIDAVAVGLAYYYQHELYHKFDFQVA